MDLVVVQCGGTTTSELQALNKPFLSFPLEEQIERRLTVAGKLKRHGVMNEMRFYDTTPEKLASMIKENLGKQAQYRPINAVADVRIAEILNKMV